VLARVGHAVALFVAIVAAVVTLPVVVVLGVTLVLDPSDTPSWWGATRWAGTAVFALAFAFLAWDTHRIARDEERGIVVSGLRLPRRPPRRGSAPRR
jgi:hypothetical protein